MLFGGMKKAAVHLHIFRTAPYCFRRLKRLRLALLAWACKPAATEETWCALGDLSQVCYVALGLRKIYNLTLSGV